MGKWVQAWWASLGFVHGVVRASGMPGAGRGIASRYDVVPLGGAGPGSALLGHKDECTGAFGVLAAVLALWLRFTALAQVLPPGRAPGFWIAVLALPPVLGRMAMGPGPLPLRASKALGSAWKQGLGLREAGALLAGGGVITARFGHQGRALWAGAGVATHLFARRVMTRVPGCTGDRYGALNEGIETLTLLLLVVWL